MKSACNGCTWIPIALVLCGFTALAVAQSVQQGQPAPASVVQQAGSVTPVRVGAQVVRALPGAVSPRAGADGSAGNSSVTAMQTIVMREPDHLVGISHHELMVVGPDLERMAASASALGLPGMEVSAYPNNRLLLIKTRLFEQLQQVHDTLAADYPQARFDMPITYFPRRPK